MRREDQGKEEQGLIGDGQAPRVTEVVEDHRSKTAFPPRADGRLHGSGRQLDRHSDRTGDPARRARGTTAA